MSNLARPSASYTLTIRIKISNTPGSLGRVTSKISEVGADIGAIDIKGVTKTHKIRELTLQARDEKHAELIVAELKALGIVEVLSVSDRTFLMHRHGKIRIVSKVPLATREDLSMAYTPGVARVCMAIHNDPKKAYTLTIKANTIAVVSDGTAVLGLGDIGPEAAMPVMEGKAMLFKEFAGVDAFPICLDTKDTEEIIRTVKNLAPTFGGINLEDISAPRCFEIEERLKKELKIPVFHDDQHGTAVVVLAALTNALKLVHKKIEDLKIVVTGVGAAGVACCQDHHGCRRKEYHRLRSFWRYPQGPQRHELHEAVVRRAHEPDRLLWLCEGSIERRGSLSRTLRAGYDRRLRSGGDEQGRYRVCNGESHS